MQRGVWGYSSLKNQLEAPTYPITSGGRLTGAAVVARLLLRDVDPRHPWILLYDGLALLVLLLPLEVPGYEKKFIVGPDGGLGVADDLDHGEATEGLGVGEGGRGSLKRVVNEVGGDVGGGGEEGDDVDIAFESPGGRAESEGGHDGG